ncbi:MAG: hypothetical protein IH586_22860 [Anaerolineaceae bacterium]|nr:hypothetical protein [Anaerolineaceae bacterium]
MPNHSAFFHRIPIIRRLWKPAALVGTSGTAAAIWFDEIVMFGEEILALLFLPILTGLIFLFNLMIFKSRVPRREEPDNFNNRGTKKGNL